MKNNKKFEAPEIEVCRFASADVLTNSIVPLGHFRKAWEISLNDLDADIYGDTNEFGQNFVPEQ